MKRNSGISLVELALALVIIGALVFTVVGARSFFEKAKARKVIEEIGNLRIAVSNFKAFYDVELPGDFPDASSYWGSSCGGNSAAPTGCNGNGNGQIGFSTNDSNYEESYRFWQHLALAEILEIDVSGVKNGSAPFVDKTNMYASKGVAGGFYYPQYPYDWDSTKFHSSVAQKSNFFLLGKAHSSLERPLDGAFKPGVAFIIDNKTDDGNPRMGGVRAFNYSDTTNGFNGSTSGFSAGTECDSIGNVSSSDSDFLSSYYEIGLDNYECIMFIDF